MLLSKLIQNLFAYVKEHELRVSLYFAEKKLVLESLWKPNPVIWLCLNALSLNSKLVISLMLIR